MLTGVEKATCTRATRSSRWAGEVQSTAIVNSSPLKRPIRASMPAAARSRGDLGEQRGTGRLAEVVAQVLEPVDLDEQQRGMA